MTIKVKDIIKMFAITFIVVANVSCIRDSFTTDSNKKLEFSVDTLTFDTIFSTIPSTTMEFRIYNKHSKSIKIDEIFMEKRASSTFRFNVDGYPANSNNSLKNIVIGAKDSLFVFVEATIEESGNNNPVYVEDNLVFSSNTNKQKVVVNAFGQDVVILKEYSLTSDEIFTADKPYLIFEYLHVPTNMTLKIEAGARIFMHKSGDKLLNTGSNNISLSNTCIVVEGAIISEGQPDNRVTIRGDRDDLAYIDIPYLFLPSQWGSIYIIGSNQQSNIKNTDIIGGDIGFALIGNASLPAKINISSSVIHCMNSYGVFSRFGNIEIDNSEISNCGKSAISQWGGSLSMTHSTVANYMPSMFLNGYTRKEPAVSINNHLISNGVTIAFPINSCVIQNSIISGNISKEIALTNNPELDIPFNVFINSSIIKSEKIESEYFYNVLWSIDENNSLFIQANPDFSDLEKSGYFNFQLSENSIAKDIANREVSQLYPIDLLGNSRLDDIAPDLGAYEQK